MAATAGVASLWSDLNKYGQNQNYEAALKTVNKLLNELPGEPQAVHCKVVCFLHLNRFTDALHLIRKSATVDVDLSFEQAYCEYRLNRTKEALTTLRSVQNPSLKIKELLAQVLYRLEEHEECFEVYKDLIRNSSDDFEDERETNLSAVVVALQQDKEDDEVICPIREDTYELSYNAACQLLACGKFSEAVAKLHETEELCRKFLEDDPDVTEEEIDAELGVIRVQRGCALQMMGKNDQALKLYNQVIKQRPTDIGLTAVASNNIVACNKDQNVFDSKKKMKVATADGLQHKLTIAQRKVISMNHCLLYMYMNQGEQCIKMAEELQEKNRDSDLPRLIQVAQLCREKHTEKATELLQKSVDDNEDISLRTKLVLAQMYLTQGHVYKACDILKNLGSDDHRPGVVSSLVTLYKHQEDMDEAIEVLDNAVEWYQKNDSDSKDLASMIQICADMHLKHGKPENASRLLEEVYRKNPQDMKTLAQLISAYSKFDQKKAQAISKDLPSVADASADIDVDALESAVSTLGTRYVKKMGKTEQSPKTPKSPERGAGDELIEKKKKKKKKKRLPKDYDPNAVIDPERWLPKRERSYYRGKRKDKRKEIGKGTQGSSAYESDTRVMSSPSASNISSPKPSQSSQPTPTPGPRQQKPQGANKKKKKGKGAKW
ncbi:signal recognition particle subunit SRP72-like [Tubulanus polymorphus]|uniref:signal recognition particle subunit SRP72-like n=1 Tax=Tubulanus polymorphus TaxID=672921 RepID=UPI003DA52102